MEFRFDDAQVELQQTMARFAEQRFPLESLAAREGAPLDRALWSGLAELGLLGVLAPEDAGGSGLGLVEATVVFEQLGSHLAPGPTLWTVLAAGLVDGAASGDVVVSGIQAAAVHDGAGLVEHAGDADVVLVAHHDRVVAHRIADLPAIEPLTPLDPLTPVARVQGLDAGGDVVGGAADAAELQLRGTVLTAAALAGIAGRALEVARAYALEREQFGVPIGSFQAVKHLLADAYVRTTLAQSEAYAAAVVADARTASAAKLLAAEAAVEVSSTAIQVLGGMGFTWDMLPNHLLKRAWVLDQSFGRADDHALALGSALLGS